MNVTAKDIETLDKALSGLKWLGDNHEAFVVSAEILIDGEVYSVSRTYDDPEDETGNGYLFVSFA